MSPFRRQTAAWADASLATRFALAGGVVLVVAALMVGLFVTDRIERGVVRNAAATTALYLDSFLAPLGNDLLQPGTRSPAARRALGEILAQSAVGLRVVSWKIWRPGGIIVDAADPALVGRQFPPSDMLRTAWAGQVAASFDDTGDEEDAGEHALGLPLLEIYSPIRADWSGEIVAVAELYVSDPDLRADLISSRRSAWVLVAVVGLALGLVLYAIVRQGSATIEAQRRALDARLADLRALSARNAALRHKVQAAAGGAATATEQALRRIGADLHDGPAQYLAFAALRLDALRAPTTADGGSPGGGDGGADGERPELDELRDALHQAMTEIRAISRGLALPDIAGRDAAAIVALAVDAHAARLGEAVTLETEGSEPPPLTPALRICLYRFVQEGLTNASRHAGARDMRVTLRCRAGRLCLSVRDGGGGIGPDRSEGLGLSGLRFRVESLGGRFTLAGDGHGTEIRMEIGEEA